MWQRDRSLIARSGWTRYLRRKPRRTGVLFGGRSMTSESMGLCLCSDVEFEMKDSISFEPATNM
jgi:hypothetical protein